MISQSNKPVYRLAMMSAMAFCSSMPALAAQPLPGKVVVVKQADGQVIDRLIRVGAPKDGVAQETFVLTQGAANAAVPRAMTALATVPNTAKANSTTSLADQVSPALALSWAEFIDPTVAAGERKLTDTPALADAVWRYISNPSQGKTAGHARQNQAVLGYVNVTTTWRSVVMEGARRNLTGGQALQEWLSLPMPEPKSNPWLSGSTGYRY